MNPRDETPTLFFLFIVGAAGVFAVLLMNGQFQDNSVGESYTVPEDIPLFYAPPWNPFSNERFLTVTQTADTATPGENVTVTVDAEGQGMLFYKDFYIYDNSVTGKWRVKHFAQTPTLGDWIADDAGATLTVNASTLDRESWVIVYACAAVGSEWRCGCSDSQDAACEKWSIENFTAPALCTDDALCVGQDVSPYCTTNQTWLVTCTAGSDGCLDATVESCTPNSCLVSGTTPACTNCVDTPPAPSTVNCGTTGTGTLCNGTGYSVPGEKCASGTCVAGSCVECVAASDCTTPPSSYDDECYAASCNSGSCSYDTTSEEGTSCTRSNGETGTCVAGSCVECAAASDCTTPPANYDDECYVASCTSDACVYAATNGACTTSTGDSGTCQSGACVTGCSDGCDPSTYTPQCGLLGDWSIYQTVCRDDNGDGCYEIVQDVCGAGQYCDQGTGCYTPVCGDGVKNGNEACDDGSNNGACPKTCSASCTLNNCGSADGDTSESACDDATDQTTEPAADPPNQLAFDYGIDWLDPWPAGAEGSGQCCGDDANEWLLRKQGDTAKTGCCNSVNDCLDDDKKCYSNDAVTTFASGQYYCYYDWWYACNQQNLCLAHKTTGFAGTKECYYTAADQYYFSNYDSPPDEECGDGVDNDCDGDVDADDSDCVDFFQSEIIVNNAFNSIATRFCVEPSSFVSQFDAAANKAEVLFSSEGKNTKKTYDFSPNPVSKQGFIVSLASCSGANVFRYVGGFSTDPDYITVRMTVDANNDVSEIHEDNNEQTIVLSLNDAAQTLCGGHGEWPCDSNNHGKWCGGADAGTCGVTCDASYTFCPDTNGCWSSC